MFFAPTPKVEAFLCRSGFPKLAYVIKTPEQPSRELTFSAENFVTNEGLKSSVHCSTNTDFVFSPAASKEYSLWWGCHWSWDFL